MGNALLSGLTARCGSKCSAHVLIKVRKRQLIVGHMALLSVRGEGLRKVMP